MNRLDSILFAVEYIISVVLSATSGTHAVSNPNFGDYIVEGFGMMLGAFLITSIFTIPIQMSSGWNKNQYVSKTIRGLPIVLAISLLSRFN